MTNETSTIETTTPEVAPTVEKKNKKQYTKHNEESIKKISEGLKKAHALRKEKLKNYEIMMNHLNIDFISTLANLE